MTPHAGDQLWQISGANLSDLSAVFRVRRDLRRFAGSRLQLTGWLSSTATFPRNIASELTNTAITRLALKDRE